MNIVLALQDPASVFSSPDEVCDEKSLTRDQKIEILRRWEYDARELEVAEDENMAGGPAGQLDLVLAALHRLGVEPDTEHSPPTRQGGESEDA